MSTPPTPLLSIQNDLTWLKTHAILIVVVVSLALGSVYGIETIISRHDAATNARWQAINQTAIAEVESLTNKLEADEKDRAAQNAQQTAILAQLATTISQRDKTTAQVVQKDQTLSALEAAEKITEQTSAQPGQVTAQGNNVQMDLSISRTVVTGLDKLPTVTQDLADTQKQLAAETSINSNLQGTVLDEQKLIDAMKTQSLDADKACKASIADLKAKDRKSKLKWFGVGYVLGLLSAHAIGI